MFTEFLHNLAFAAFCFLRNHTLLAYQFVYYTFPMAVSAAGTPVGPYSFLATVNFTASILLLPAASKGYESHTKALY